MKNEGFTLRKRLESFRYAFNGIKIVLAGEPNARIHCIAAATVVTAGFLFDLSPAEWIAVVIVTGAVFTAEALNTAIERLADAVSPGYHETIKQVKDLSAAAVLFMSIAAAITGAIIFLPKLLMFLFR
ncbi:MAG: diacylglycerol kinase family protein [Tannerellaceae bacterium]|jgi:diacylglycerol kinase (ATP)|nr:diacylglycerol kinase family protein [Tannerellaceae bacterium]